jgi:hypothetical protein
MEDTINTTVSVGSAEQVDKWILRKIKKLLTHAEHNNADPNEAAVAAAQANRLMERYRLNRAIVEAQTGDESKKEPVGEEVIYHLRTKTIQNWIGYLATAISKSSNCKFYWDRKTDAAWVTRPCIVAIGRQTDRMAFKMLLEFVVTEIDRLATLATKSRASGRHGSKTFANNFRLGAVETISRRLREMEEQKVTPFTAEEQEGASGSDKPATPPTEATMSQALVILQKDREEVDLYYKDLSTKLHLRTRAVSQINWSGEGRRAGREAGNNIHLGGRLNESSPAKALR